MTIAVSVMVSPSRLLTAASRGMAALAALALALILFANSNLSAIFRFQISLVASILLGCAIFMLRRPGKTFHIDISGIGQIRLTQYSGVSAFHEKESLALDGASGLVVHLRPDSVLWPQCLLLRLNSEHGNVYSIPVLPDSISGPGFAELSVVFRYIATRNANGKIID